MSDNIILVGIILVVVSTTFAIVSVIMNKKSNPKSTGKSTAPVKPSTPVVDRHAESIVVQKDMFSKMTVAQLKVYVKENKSKLGESTGRMPTKKAELIEAAMQIFQSRTQ
jgi:flagellar basal body-associated protein FliL